MIQIKIPSIKLNKITIISIFLSFSLIGYSLPEVRFENGAFPFMSSFCTDGESNWNHLELAKIETEHAWQEFKGDELLKETVKIFNRDFYENQIKATVIACKNKQSISTPLLINVRTTSGDWNKRVRLIIATTLFHEILHSYIIDNFNFRKLINQSEHRDENMIVRNHIYLMAIEQCVYKRKGLSNYIKIAEEKYKDSPHYNRTWNIINEKSCEALIAEMKKFKL